MNISAAASPKAFAVGWLATGPHQMLTIGVMEWKGAELLRRQMRIVFRRRLGGQEPCDRPPAIDQRATIGILRDRPHRTKIAKGSSTKFSGRTANSPRELWKQIAST